MTSIVSNASAKSVRLSVASTSNLSTPSVLQLERLSDAELVAAYRAGNENALSILLLRHEDNLHRFLMSKTHDYDVTADLALQTVMSVWKCLSEGRYCESSNFKSWLLTIALNKFKDSFRKASRSVEDRPIDLGIFMDPNVEDSDPRDPIDPVDEAEKKEALLCFVEEKVKELPAKQREVIEMRLQGLSYAEIAVELGVTLNTALGRGHNAMESLKKLCRNCFSEVA